MYLWVLAGRDPRAVPILTGASGELAGAMLAAEPLLKDGRAFVAVIEEVRFHIDVAGLEEHYVPTGRTWHGRRTTAGGVHWDARSGLSDTMAVYRGP